MQSLTQPPKNRTVMEQCELRCECGEGGGVLFQPYTCSFVRDEHFRKHAVSYHWNVAVWPWCLIVRPYFARHFLGVWLFSHACRSNRHCTLEWAMTFGVRATWVGPLHVCCPAFFSVHEQAVSFQVLSNVGGSFCVHELAMSPMVPFTWGSHHMFVVQFPVCVHVWAMCFTFRATFIAAGLRAVSS